MLALVAGLAGGIVGFFGFFWIWKQGFYALVLPGGLVGICASVFKPKSAAVCVLCGLLALAIGLFTEWKRAPWVKDDSLLFFLMHVHKLQPVSLIMIGVGTLLGVGIPWNHRRDASKTT
jgi:hypothetical protein